VEVVELARRTRAPHHHTTATDDDAKNRFNSVMRLVLSAPCFTLHTSQFHTFTRNSFTLVGVVVTVLVLVVLVLVLLVLSLVLVLCRFGVSSCGSTAVSAVSAVHWPDATTSTVVPVVPL
jgi:hypothetical protein